MPKNHRLKTTHVVISLLFLGHTQSLLAADAGQQLNQIERIQDQKEPLRAPPTIETEKQTTRLLQEGVRATFTQFVFEGNHLFTSAELQDYLKEYLNREITFDELKLAVDSLTIYYKERGYLGTATLPKQDIGDGTVRIVIVEAKFGGAKVDVDSNIKYRVKPEIIQRFIEANNPSGQMLNLKTLDRAALIANELPGIAITQSLRTGSKEGETDALVRLTNRAAYVASLSSDNYGFKSTGRERYLINASIFSPLGIGDRLDLTYLHTSGTEYGRAALSRPLGYSGLRMAVNASALKYEVIAGAGLSLKPEGTAETLEIEASYPTIRTRTLSVTSNASVEGKHFRNTSINGLESNYLVSLLSLGSSLNHRNTLTLAGETYASLSIDMGYADYSNSPVAFRDDKSSQGIDGQFTRLKWNVNNTQFYTDTISSVIKFNGQVADSNLDSSQKIYLGGATGVRAYPSSEGSGSEGFLLNLELHKELPANLTLVGFYDYGFARQYVDNTNKSTGLANATGHNAFNMKGYGTSLEWSGVVGKFRPKLSLVWSRRIGENPNPQADGTDSDGTSDKNFYWINGAINF